MKTSAIIKGHINELLNREEELSKSRLKICKKCPLLTNSIFGLMCDSARYLEPSTNEVSYFPRPNMYRGCGCRLDAKTRLIDENCPAKKW